MKYTNDKIKKLIAQREAIEQEIEKEYEIEKAKYKFSWKRFFILIMMFIVMVTGVHINGKLFKKGSICSWETYTLKWPENKNN